MAWNYFLKSIHESTTRRCTRRRRCRRSRAAGGRDGAREVEAGAGGNTGQLGETDLCFGRKLPGRHSDVWQHYSWLGSVPDEPKNSNSNNDRRSGSSVNPQSLQQLQQVHWQEFRTSSLKRGSQEVGWKVILLQTSTIRETSPARSTLRIWMDLCGEWNLRSLLLLLPQRAIRAAVKNERIKTGTGLIWS